MRSRSNTLFHFTKNLESIKSILKNGLYPRYSLEDLRWHGVNDKYMAWAMSCFCDIPLSRITEHTDFYGSYGLGITRDFAMKNGFSPVIYIMKDGYMDGHLRSIYYLVYDAAEEGKKDGAIEISLKLLRHIKPIEGKMNVAGKTVEKEFYVENEWRYVPEDASPMTLDVYENKEQRDKHNQYAEKYGLTVTPSDIKYIFVKNDADIPGLVNFINDDLDHFSAADLKILSTRITSIESLQDDI